MAFIRTRKLKYDNENHIVSGTAAIIECHYIPGNVKNHSRQVVREKLGKVVELYSNKCGLFLSPTRGLVVYNSEKDEFSDPVTKEEVPEAIEDSAASCRLFPDANVHTVFGDSYLLFEILRKTGLLRIMQKAFPEKVFFERFLCHMLHGILKDGRVSGSRFRRYGHRWPHS